MANRNPHSQALGDGSSASVLRSLQEVLSTARRVNAPSDAELLAQDGETPLTGVELRIEGKVKRVWLKLEGFSRWGSIKDRTALSLLDELEAEGRIRPRDTIVESTSGNLGVALAASAAERGYRFVAVVDPKTPHRACALMRECGAEVQVVKEPDETGGFLLTRLARVQELLDRPGTFWTNQYGSPANPRAHEKGTGPEIYRQSNGQIDSLFVAVSTGGTLAGVAKYLRTASPQTTIVAVDARGSVALGGKPGPRRLNGIGSSRASEFVQPWMFDCSALVSDEEAFCCCRTLHSAIGLRVGGSSGAVLAACVNSFLDDDRDAEFPVCICADGGEGYLDTIYDDGWLTAGVGVRLAKG